MNINTVNKAFSGVANNNTHGGKLRIKGTYAKWSNNIHSQRLFIVEIGWFDKSKSIDPKLDKAVAQNNIYVYLIFAVAVLTASNDMLLFRKLLTR